MAKKIQIDNRKCISSYAGSKINEQNYNPVDLFIDVNKYKLQVRDIVNNTVTDLADLNVTNGNDAIIMECRNLINSTSTVFYFNIQKDSSYVDRGIDLSIYDTYSCGMSNGKTDDACTRVSSSSNNYTYTKISISSNAVSGGSISTPMTIRSCASNGTSDRGICVGKNTGTGQHSSEYITISTKSNAIQSSNSGSTASYSYQATSNGKLDTALVIFNEYNYSTLNCYNTTISSNSHSLSSVGTITSNPNRYFGNITSNDIYDKAIYITFNGYASDVITVSSSSIASVINQDKYFPSSFRQYSGNNTSSNYTTSNGIGDLGVMLVTNSPGTSYFIYRIRVSTLGDSIVLGQNVANLDRYSMESNGAV